MSFSSIAINGAALVMPTSLDFCHGKEIHVEHYNSLTLWIITVTFLRNGQLVSLCSVHVARIQRKHTQKKSHLHFRLWLFLYNDLMNEPAYWLVRAVWLCFRAVCNECTGAETLRPLLGSFCVKKRALRGLLKSVQISSGIFSLI